MSEDVECCGTIRAVERRGRESATYRATLRVTYRDTIGVTDCGKLWVTNCAKLGVTYSDTLGVTYRAILMATYCANNDNVNVYTFISYLQMAASQAIR